MNKDVLALQEDKYQLDFAAEKGKKLNVMLQLEGIMYANQK